MDISNIATLSDIEKFLKSSVDWELKPNGKKETYEWMQRLLLHKVDSVHRLAGPATKKILEREYDVFGNKEFRKLQNISVSHIYNLRKRTSYLRRGKNFEKTKSVAVMIGKRMKPKPNGRPGFLRVDSVHQGDLERQKGVYYINKVVADIFTFRRRKKMQH